MDRVYNSKENSIRCEGFNVVGALSPLTMDNFSLDYAFLQEFYDCLSDITYKKHISIALSEKYASVFGSSIRYDISRAYRLAHCGDRLYFSKLGSLVSANFCRDRICSICNWRRSMKIFSKLSCVLNEINDLYGFKYIFLTLTVKNCSAVNLKDTISLISESFRRFYQIKMFKGAVRGYFKSLEITYNQDTCSYHPHLHVVLAVDYDYFDNFAKYMDIRNIVSSWRRCLRVDYDPVCYIESVKNYTYKSVLEVSKYILKGNDFLSVSDFDFYYLVDSIAGVRFVSSGGIIKTYLHLDDLESDTANLNNPCNDNYLVLFVWRSGVYSCMGFVPNFLL